MQTMINDDAIYWAKRDKVLINIQLSLFFFSE